MNIAVDCADLDHNRIDGTRVYIKNLLNHFGRIDQKSNFFLYHKNTFNELLRPKMYKRYTERIIPYPLWWTQTRFAYELRKDEPDVCWMPIQQIPFIGPEKTKYVVTIHDLAFKIFKDHFTFKDRLKLNFFSDTAIKRSDAIIAISNSTKKDILKFFPKTKEDKISVIHHGFDPDNFIRKFSQEEQNKILRKYGICDDKKVTEYKVENCKYIIYVGAIQPRKNLITLLRAFENIKNKGSYDDLKLVCVGEAAWLSEGIIKKFNESQFEKDIILTGKVDFKDLACLYQAAKISVYPSLYEGFGIPLLEAFATETPVICAKNSSLVEVGGNAALFFESESIDDLANKLQKVLTNDILRTEMIEKGKRRASMFSWEKCAQKTFEVFQKQNENKEKREA